jgi:hypothetical protein
MVRDRPQALAEAGRGEEYGDGEFTHIFLPRISQPALALRTRNRWPQAN